MYKTDDLKEKMEHFGYSVFIQRGERLTFSLKKENVLWELMVANSNGHLTILFYKTHPFSVEEDVQHMVMDHFEQVAQENNFLFFIAATKMMDNFIEKEGYHSTKTDDIERLVKEFYPGVFQKKAQLLSAMEEKIEEMKESLLLFDEGVSFPNRKNEKSFYYQGYKGEFKVEVEKGIFYLSEGKEKYRVDSKEEIKQVMEDRIRKIEQITRIRNLMNYPQYFYSLYLDQIRLTYMKGEIEKAIQGKYTEEEREKKAAYLLKNEKIPKKKVLYHLELLPFLDHLLVVDGMEKTVFLCHSLEEAKTLAREKMKKDMEERLQGIDFF